MKFAKLGALCAGLIAAFVCGYFVYMAWAFPEVRCEAAKHLDAGKMEGDCFGCHAKATPVVAQQWNESKHGLILVRCQTCHGMPNGRGAFQFTRSPGVDVCIRCHAPAVQRMNAKFGKVSECSSCHPYHQSPMHGMPFQYRQPTTQTALN